MGGAVFMSTVCSPRTTAKRRWNSTPCSPSSAAHWPLPYNEQPYFPNVSVVAPAPTGGGPHLVYLDVWQREVTLLADGDLVEKAVGVDTTTRQQTVWQVKVLHQRRRGRNLRFAARGMERSDRAVGWPAQQQGRRRADQYRSLLGAAERRLSRSGQPFVSDRNS